MDKELERLELLTEKTLLALYLGETEVDCLEPDSVKFSLPRTNQLKNMFWLHTLCYIGAMLRYSI